MKLRKILFVAVLTVFTMAGASAQDILWRAEFDFRFDNREYSSMEDVSSGTIFGTRFSPQLGVAWGENYALRGRQHTLAGGVEFISDFGTAKLRSWEPFLYYHYTAPRVFDTYAGSFPRRIIKGEYSTAFFSDETLYYDNLIQGFYIRYGGDSESYVEAAIDWIAYKHGEQREKFMILSSGELNFLSAVCDGKRGGGIAGNLFAGYNMTVMHYAASEVVTGVMDNILVYPYVGGRMEHVGGNWEMSLRAGWLQSLQRDRKGDNVFRKPGGFHVSAGFRWKGFGLTDTVYLGEGIMTYYDSTDAAGMVYGSGLYSGDLFYNTSDGIYNRLEVFWEKSFGKATSLKISSIHHYDGRNWGWQQMLTISIDLNGKFRSEKAAGE